MYNKDLDFYTPLGVSNGENGRYCFYINKDVKLEAINLIILRDIWYMYEDFDNGFAEFLDRLFGK